MRCLLTITLFLGLGLFSIPAQALSAEAGMITTDKQLEDALEKPVRKLNKKIGQAETTADVAKEYAAITALRARTEGIHHDHLGFMLINIHTYFDDWDPAIAIARDIVDHPGSEQAAARALYILAQIAVAQPDTAQARTNLKALIEEAKSLEIDAERLAAIERLEMSLNLRVGEVFPHLAFTATDGTAIDLAQLTAQNKVVLIDFWATWCGPCVDGMPALQLLHQTHANDGFEIVGINVDEDRAAFDSFLTNHSMTWPQYFDGLGWDNHILKRFHLDSIPTTFLVSNTGIIIGVDLEASDLATAIQEQLSTE